MASYVMLFNYTHQGIERIKESPARIDAARQALRSVGGELKQWYLAMGKYDGVVVIEAPDDETVAKFALATGALGNVRTETLRVFTEEEFRKMVADLP